MNSLNQFSPTTILRCISAATPSRSTHNGTAAHSTAFQLKLHPIKLCKATANAELYLSSNPINKPPDDDNMDFINSTENDNKRRFFPTV